MYFKAPKNTLQAYYAVLLVNTRQPFSKYHDSYKTLNAGVGFEHLHQIVSPLCSEWVVLQLQVGDDIIILKHHRRDKELIEMKDRDSWSSEMLHFPSAFTLSINQSDKIRKKNNTVKIASLHRPIPKVKSSFIVIHFTWKWMFRHRVWSLSVFPTFKAMARAFAPRSPKP